MSDFPGLAFLRRIVPMLVLAAALQPPAAEAAPAPST